MRNKVILVDKNDQAIGEMDKLDAHLENRLHRAFSIFVFNAAGELLIQRRALGKYHSGGLWSNTCCSHPFPGESNMDAAHRRLQEEMGFDCPLQEQPSITYQAELDHGLCEHEFDHIFFGQFDGTPVGNDEEVSEWEWISADNLKQRLNTQSETFSSWLKMILQQGRLGPEFTLTPAA